MVEEQGSISPKQHNNFEQNGSGTIGTKKATNCSKNLILLSLYNFFFVFMPTDQVKYYSNVGCTIGNRIHNFFLGFSGGGEEKKVFF